MRAAAGSRFAEEVAAIATARKIARKLAPARWVASSGAVSTRLVLPLIIGLDARDVTDFGVPSESGCESSQS